VQFNLFESEVETTQKLTGLELWSVGEREGKRKKGQKIGARRGKLVPGHYFQKEGDETHGDGGGRGQEAGRNTPGTAAGSLGIGTRQKRNAKLKKGSGSWGGGSVLK